VTSIPLNGAITDRTQSVYLGDDHNLRRHAREIAGRQRAGDLLKVLKSHSDMESVKNRRFGDAGISEYAEGRDSHR